MTTSNQLNKSITVDEVTKMLGVDTQGPSPGSQINKTLLFIKFEDYKKAVSNIRKMLGKPVVTPSALTWDYKNGQLIIGNDPSPAFEVMFIIDNK